jgi:hypothetical protein
MMLRSVPFARTLTKWYWSLAPLMGSRTTPRGVKYPASILVRFTLATAKGSETPGLGVSVAAYRGTEFAQKAASAPRYA